MFPHQSPRFLAYIAPARAYPQLWRLILGLCLLLAVYLVVVLLIFSFGGVVLAMSDAGHRSLRVTNADFASPLGMAILLLTFAGGTLGVALAAKILHRRGFGTLIAPDFAVARDHVVKTVHIILPVFIVVLLISSVIYPPVAHLDFLRWLSWMPLALPLLLLQTATEEIIFRGYIQQQLAARFRSRWIWMAVPALVFGLLHYDPAELGPNAWLVVADTALIGFVAADLTARTGNLGAAITYHFLNNFFALFAVSMAGPMSGLALYLSPVDVSDVAQMRNIVLFDLATNLILYLIYARIMTRRGL